ncbi:hypothetical protein PINS_up002982 [Pythium insidiosum]|nr:hypothetical protein PINS_up002982 [Pythium insidiosum]
MRQRDDAVKRVVDALVRSTVRDVLFSADRSGLAQLPFERGRHVDHVMRYPTRSTEDLMREKRQLKRLLKDVQARQRFTSPEEPHAEDDDSTTLLEVYALLKLFLASRELGTDQSTSNNQRELAVPLPLLHAQLLLYSKYFAESKKRTVSLREDVLPIERMYQFFMDSQQQGSLTL